jgi:hypothetical protein
MFRGLWRWIFSGGGLAPAADWGGVFRRYADTGRDFGRGEDSRRLARAEPGRVPARDHDHARRVPRHGDMGRDFDCPESSARGGT